MLQPNYVEIGVGVAEHPSEGRVCVIDYGAQIIPHKKYQEMVDEKAKAEEEAKNGPDVSNVNWEELSRRVFEEINKVREKPKSLIKQLERSLHSLDTSRCLRVKGRHPVQLTEGMPAYMEAIEWLEQ